MSAFYREPPSQFLALSANRSLKQDAQVAKSASGRQHSPARRAIKNGPIGAVFDKEAVEKFYRRWEKKPLEDLPVNLRFTSNPRHVIVLHVRYGSKGSVTETLQGGLERLSIRARNWEKFDAVLYFGIVDLARTVFLCENLRGNNLTLNNLWCLLR